MIFAWEAARDLFWISLFVAVAQLIAVAIGGQP